MVLGKHSGKLYLFFCYIPPVSSVTFYPSDIYWAKVVFLIDHR